MLSDPVSQWIAEMKDGQREAVGPNQEIARRLGCIERSVERKLHRIRVAWESELTV